jgi:hypothetical protein
MTGNCSPEMGRLWRERIFFSLIGITFAQQMQSTWNAAVSGRACGVSIHAFPRPLPARRSSTCPSIATVSCFDFL